MRSLNILLQNKCYFITGTDTGVGKTYCTLKMLQHFQKQGYTASAYKLVESGGDDHQQLSKQSSRPTPHPLYFKKPIAPHLSSREQGMYLTYQIVKQHALSMIEKNTCDITLIEGAGGWAVPLEEKRTMADVIQSLKLDVILIVPIRLGCLNHAILTIHHIQQKDLKIKGWIANIIDPDQSHIEEQIHTLDAFMDAPLLTMV